MKSYFFRLLLLLLVIVPHGQIVVAQDNPDQIIASIKANNAYIWAEAVTDNFETAETQAVQSLRTELLNRYRGTLTQAGVQSDLQTEAQRRSLRFNYQKTEKEERRNRRVFVYLSVVDAENFIQAYITFPYRNREVYLFGDATGTSRDEAVSNARTSLVNQMVVQVFSDRELTVEGVNDDYTEEFRSQARAISQMQLVGAEEISYQLGGIYHSFVYITRANQELSFNVIRNQVLSFISEAERQNRIGNISVSMNNYYRAFLLSHNYHRNIEHRFMDGESTENLRDYLRLKIENFLYNMPVEVSPAYEFAERFLEIPFKIDVPDHRLSGVQYHYQLGNNRQTSDIRLGAGKIEVSNYFPSSRIEFMDVDFWIDIRDALANNPVLEYLEEFNSIRVRRNLEVDFSNVLKPTIRANIEGGRVSFFIHSRLLTVTNARWEFGDGEIGFGQSPVHQYEEADEYQVTVIVNNDLMLSDTKFVNLFNGIIHNRSQLRTLSPQIASLSEKLSGVPVPVAAVPVTVPELPEITEEQPTTESEQETETVPVPIPVPDQPAPQEPNYLDVYSDLMGFSTTPGLIRQIRNLSSREVITFGNQSSFTNSDGALVIIADENRVFDYLIFINSRYLKIETGEEIVNLGEYYTGKRQIWVKVND